VGEHQSTLRSTIEATSFNSPAKRTEQPSFVGSAQREPKSKNAKRSIDHPVNDFDIEYAKLIAK